MGAGRPAAEDGEGTVPAGSSAEEARDSRGRRAHTLHSGEGRDGAERDATGPTRAATATLDGTEGQVGGKRM